MASQDWLQKVKRQCGLSDVSLIVEEVSVDMEEAELVRQELKCLRRVATHSVRFRTMMKLPFSGRKC